MLCLDAEPNITHYKLAELNKDILRAFYDAMRSEQNWKTGGLLAENKVRRAIPVFAGSCPMQWRQVYHAQSCMAGIQEERRAAGAAGGG